MLGAPGWPPALTVAVPRSRLRDAALCGLNMWAYLAAYEMPHDDPQRWRERVRIDYRSTSTGSWAWGCRRPCASKRGRDPDHINRLERVLVWCHWIWFAVPHGSLAYMLWRRPERFPAAAARMYARVRPRRGLYWAIPTAPPWYAAREGRMRAPDGRVVRRMMIEYGEQFGATAGPTLRCSVEIRSLPCRRCTSPRR